MINHLLRTMDIIINLNFEDKFDLKYSILLNKNSFTKALIQ